MKKKTVGLSRRDLEWALEGMIRQVPSDPASLARLLGGVVVTLIEKNNAALAQSIHDRDGDGDEET